jgi:hypothetical protein
VTVDGAEGVEERGVVGEGAAGAVADGFDGEVGAAHWWGMDRASVGRGRRVWLRFGGWMASSAAVELGWIGGAEVEQAEADSGMELMEVPPEMWPTLRVVRGVWEGEWEGVCSRASRARARMRMGLGRRRRSRSGRRGR